LCHTQIREIKVIQNTKILQNREIKVSRNMRTTKSRNKRVAKISCNKVDCLYFGWTMKTSLHQKIEKLIKLKWKQTATIFKRRVELNDDT